MRKEIILAIAAGAVVGISIAFGIWRANIALKPSQKPQVVEEQEEEESTFGVTIATPGTNSVVVTSPGQLSGITAPSSWIAVSSADEDYITQADDQGSFNLEIDLAGGLNQILVSAITDALEVATKQVLVVHSTQFAKHITSDDIPENPEATSEADLIREKVKKKVAEAKIVPVFYIGTVTDISESTLQLKNSTSEIQQVAVMETTDYVKQIKTNQEIEFTDVAIGDFIVAMGFVNGNSVLDGKRILVTSPPETQAKTVVFGIVDLIEKKAVAIKTNDGIQKLSFPARWKGPDIDEIAEGDLVIAIGTPDEDSIQIRTVEIISTATPEE